MPKKNVFALLALGAFSLAQFMVFVPSAQAAALTAGSLSLSDSRPGQTAVNYTFSFSNVTSTSIQCVQAVFSDAATGGSAPAGMVTSGVSNGGGTMSNPDGFGSWTAASPSTGTVRLSHSSPTTGENGTVIFGGITNGTTDDTGYFARFTTYSDQSCTTAVDSSTVMFIYTTGQVVSVTVDPTLSFTIAGVASGQTVNGATTNVATTTDANLIPLGTVSSGTQARAAHDLTVGTNAAGGYSVYTRYTNQLMYGANVIADHTGSHATPTSFPGAGTAAFGYTTNEAALTQFTSNTWAAFTTSNAVVATSAVPTSETTRVGYQVGVASTTPAGNYTTTIIYTATPTY